MRIVTKEQAQNELAKENAQNVDLYSMDLEEIFLYGVIGIDTYNDEELVDAWVTHCGHSLRDDIAEITENASNLVAQLVDGDTKVLYNIFQDDNELNFEKV